MPLRMVLREDLKEARRARDPGLVSLLGTLIAAIENAEAVDVPVAVDGPSEVPRRILSDEEILRIVQREGAELRTAANEYEQHGQPGEAERLRALARVTDRYANQDAV